MVIIHENDILNANSYLSGAVKDALARLMAVLCAEKTEVENADKFIPVPPVYRENRLKRQQFMTGVLAGCYLGIKYETEKIKVIGEDGSAKEQDVKFLMRMEDFDAWGESHVINQLERLKKSKTKGVADKIFDILQDYRIFENMLLGAIRDELERRNDLTGRLTQMMQMQAAPEFMEAFRGELESLKTAMKVTEK